MTAAARRGASPQKQKAPRSAGLRSGWLLFFYSVPSRPVSKRMKVWRRLARAGAVQLKGAVYVLPHTDENYELFQWLAGEVASMGGEAAFTRVAAIDSIRDEEIKALFNLRLAGEYRAIGKSLDDLETRANSIRKGSKTQEGKKLPAQLVRVRKNFEEVLRTDFFSSGEGVDLRARLGLLTAAIQDLAGPPAGTKPPVVASKRIEDYRGRTWVSRRRPFVDRMASAWLIRRFIDRSAAFRLLDEKDIPSEGRHVAFDVRGGEFTHLGDLCTFEVMAKAFGIRDKAVRKLAEIVHELDIRDDKYRNPEARGVEEILLGLRRSEQDDMKLLEKGMSVFEMLYMSKG